MRETDRRESLDLILEGQELLPRIEPLKLPNTKPVVAHEHHII